MDEIFNSPSLHLQLDTSRICNQKCVFCYKHSESESPEKPFLSVSEVNSILENSGNIGSVSLVNNGEFLLNPEWKEITEAVFRKASEKSFTVSLNTNGTLMSSEKSDFLIALVLKYKISFHLTFSINSVTPETYEKITGKAFFRECLENSMNFIEKNIEKNNPVSVSAQFLIAPENAHEAVMFSEFWDGFFKKHYQSFSISEDLVRPPGIYSISFRRLLSTSSDGSKLFQEISRGIQGIRTAESILETGHDYFRRKACAYAWSFPAVSENGAYLCCRDTDMKICLKTEEDRLNVVRNHLLGYFETPSICENCSLYPVLPDEIIHGNFPKLEKQYRKRLETGLPYEIRIFEYPDGFSEKAEEFLKDNNLSIYPENVPVNKKHEEFFCAAWLSVLRITDSGEIVSGCEKVRISAQNYGGLREKLRKCDFSVLPDECVFCREKYSFDHLRDAYLVYGTEMPHGAFSFYGKIPVDFEENMFSLHEISWDFYSGFDIRELERQEVCDIMVDSENIFLVSLYGTRTESHTIEILDLFLENKWFLVPYPELYIKFIDVFSETYFSDRPYFNKNESGFRKLKTSRLLYDPEYFRGTLHDIMLKYLSLNIELVDFYQSFMYKDTVLETLKYLLLRRLSGKMEVTVKHFLIFSKYFLSPDTDFEKYYELIFRYLLVKKKFHTIMSFSEKLDKRFFIENQKIIFSVINIDFSEITPSFIKFFVVFSEILPENLSDFCWYRIFSWYSGKKEFEKALCAFRRIRKKVFWTKGKRLLTEAWLRKNSEHGVGWTIPFISGKFLDFFGI